MKRSKAKKLNPLEMVIMSVGAAGLLLIVGTVLLFVPFIGLLLGPVCYLGILVAPFVIMGMRKGKCPVCGNNMALMESEKCKRCKKVVVLDKRRNEFVVYD